MKRRTLIKNVSLSIPALAYFNESKAASVLQHYAATETADSPFKPSWESLSQYKVPDWFRDAKFGIWAHWGAQCQPEFGDWYARGMYQEGSDQYKYHLEKYGHPSKFGFKDVIHEWKAEKWKPDELLALYKKAGARYFVAFANHHDNFDNYDSSYQSWTSVKHGPKKDLIGGWMQAAKKQQLPFGVSIHAAHAWSWYEVAQRSDKTGPMAGIPYDGKLITQDGKGKWWNGLDPQELYEQHHRLSEASENNSTIHKQWNWGNGVTVPDKKYFEKFYNRTIELINKYQPDLLYFDDTALPMWPVNDAGLRIAAYMYNESIKRHGKLQAVINGKILDEEQRKCMVWDIERGASNTSEPFVWQTDTCIGQWHYDRRVYSRKQYKTAKMVIRTLSDVVSKNGNLLLNVPVRGDGSIDELELAIVEEIGKWMEINSESIYGTRPWKIYGEGPAIATAAPLNAQGFNEGKNKPLDAEDFRFTTKDSILYATFFGWPASGKIKIKSLAGENHKVSGIIMLGYDDKISWSKDSDGLSVQLPEQRPCDYAYVLKIQQNRTV
ncbi:MAG: alpha-L-fucosidase [Bacteroidota bacterium]